MVIRKPSNIRLCWLQDHRYSATVPSNNSISFAMIFARKYDLIEERYPAD